MQNTTNPAGNRGIAFEGTRNFRDLGGIATASGITRFGIVYRSERLSNLTTADGAAFRALGIATIIDMRSNDERERAPNRLPRDLPARQIARAFLPQHTHGMIDAINSGRCDAAQAHAMMLRQYEALALDHTADYRQILADLLIPDGVPVVFHCTSGKDRTGMVAAIILLALGAPVEAVIEDYILTHDRIEKVDFFNDAADPGAVEIVMAAKPEYLEAALAAMRDRYGSTQRYLSEGIGLTADQRQRLTDLLLDA
jgi:protein-tyrosine phosphatase